MYCFNHFSPVGFFVVVVGFFFPQHTDLLAVDIKEVSGIMLRASSLPMGLLGIGVTRTESLCW